MCKKKLSLRRSRSVLLSKREKRRQKSLEGETATPVKEKKTTRPWEIRPGHGKEALF